MLLKEDKFNDFEDLINKEIEILKGKLHSIDINDILKIIGFNA